MEVVLLTFFFILWEMSVVFRIIGADEEEKQRKVRRGWEEP
jgi:hypothetical protein